MYFLAQGAVATTILCLTYTNMVFAAKFDRYVPLFGMWQLVPPRQPIPRKVYPSKYLRIAKGGFALWHENMPAVRVGFSVIMITEYVGTNMGTGKISSHCMQFGGCGRFVTS